MELMMNILVCAVLIHSMCIAVLLADRFCGSKEKPPKRIVPEKKAPRPQMSAEEKRKSAILKREMENFYKYDGTEQYDPEQMEP